MTDTQTEARAIVTEALPPHEQAILGHDAVTVLTALIATALAKRREDEGIYTDANLVEAASSRIAELEAENVRQSSDIAEFMRRLGPRWFLEQGWFPESMEASDDL